MHNTRHADPHDFHRKNVRSPSHNKKRPAEGARPTNTTLRARSRPSKARRVTFASLVPPSACTLLCSAHPLAAVQVQEIAFRPIPQLARAVSSRGALKQFCFWRALLISFPSSGPSTTQGTYFSAHTFCRNLKGDRPFIFLKNRLKGTSGNPKMLH